MPQPWEQRKGEPTDSYARFIFFRNLGPRRQLQLAYREYAKTFRNANADAIESKKPQPIPGHWGNDSAQFEWFERANAYDLHLFKKFGERAIVKFVAALDKIADRVCEALAKPSMRPKNWNDVVNALSILQQYAIPGTVNDVRTRTEHPADEPGTTGTPVSCLAEVGAGSIPLEQLTAGGECGDDLG